MNLQVGGTTQVVAVVGMTVNRLTTLTLLLAIATLAACGASGVASVKTTSPDATSAPGTTTAPATSGADGGIELRLESGGGLLPPDFAFRTMPALVVYADGLVVTPGAQIAIYPAPALPGLVARHLDGAGRAELKRVITEAGLVTATPPDYADAPVAVADAPTTTLTVSFDGVTATHSAYALALGDRPESGARKTLAAVIARLTDLAALVGPAHIGPETAFAPTRFAIRASATAADPSAPVVDWPLTAVALAGATTCLVVDDPAAPALFASMSTATRVRQQATIYSLAVRPALPGEPGCGTGG